MANATKSKRRQGHLLPGGVSSNFYDPREKSEPFRVEQIAVGNEIFEPPRTNCFTVVWIQSGSGTFWADAARHAFHADQLLFFVPYQYVRFASKEPMQAAMLYFHANFLCVETFHAETGCSGTLFNDPYSPPLITLDDQTKEDVVELLRRMHREQDQRRLAYQDALLSYMKVLLVTATRLKASRSETCATGSMDFRHPVLTQLRDLIEQHYRTLHSPSDYAAMLHMTPKALGRCVRQHLGTTLTELIRARVLTHAKWQLLHTLRPIKEIAAEVGFRDELYFSRLFKKATGVSPKFFRQFETEIRGGSNLSMSSTHAPIPDQKPGVDHAGVSARGPR